jgi:SAM-dependent methyltransferase
MSGGRAPAEPAADPFPAFHQALLARHLDALTFSEVRRALQALSSVYVERRHRLAHGAALDGAGKRAAFALYYGPLHFLLVREIVRRLGSSVRAARLVLDLGCGTGTAGAAWALECGGPASVEGVDTSGWAVDEAQWTLRQLGLRGRCRRGDATRATLATRPAGILAAFTVNELDEEGRARLLPRLVEAAGKGSIVLVVEPLSRRTSPWWPEWAGAAAAAGGRADEWRFPAALPQKLALLGRAAGLETRELLGSSLLLGGPSAPREREPRGRGTGAS